LPKNDDGEFELVLGNRQLISVFAIVVVLLAVFFSMGYIVGRNSSSATETARIEKAAAAPDASDEPSAETPADEPAPAPATNPATATAEDSTPPASTPPPATKPQQPAPTPAPVKIEPARPVEPVHQEPARPKEKEVKAKPSPAPPPVTPIRPPVRASAGEPSSGQYWQVVATSRPDAEIISEALAKKGFHSVLSPAPKDGIFRVLVGPLGDTAAQAQTRTGLESAGFKNPILRKY
jgi:cell division septation protein DedD